MEESTQHPLNFFDHLEKIRFLCEKKDIFLFLDYDGTLTPIVATPDLAVLSETMRETVSQVSKTIKVSIVSGRGTADVRNKVQIEGLYYAGSHGFEILDPKGFIIVNKEADEIRGTIDEVYDKLSKRLKGIPGALVENVKYTISAHYRLVAEKDFSKIVKVVDDILMEYPVLKKTEGKKVFEIRPKIDWDKGKAVKWILSHLGFEKEKHLPIYIGDDTTDEDAFRFIKDKGLSILVSPEEKDTEAQYLVSHPEEVQHVLEFFMEIRK